MVNSSIKKKDNYPDMMAIEQEYLNLSGDYYDQKESSEKNILRKYFHSSRQIMVEKNVTSIYKKGDVIVDLGCGAVNWNKNKLPVIGVDINKKMLAYAKKKQRLKSFIVNTIDDAQFKDASVDIVIITEVLEHMPNYKEIVKKIYKMLKPEGHLIITVPYDTIFSLWKPLFETECFIKGNIMGNVYYKYRCGHVNHFSPRRLKKILEYEKFKIQKYESNFRLNFLFIAQKQTK